MVQISKLFSQNLSFQVQNSNTLVRFQDRARCLHATLWTVIEAYEQGQRQIIVYDNEENLKQLNYLFSKYKLSNELLLLNSSRLTQSPKGMIFPIEHNLDKNNQNDLLLSKLKTLKEELSLAIYKLKKERLGKKTTADIIDMVSQNSLNHLEADRPILRPPYSYEFYQEKKRLFVKAEKLYEDSFRYTEEIDPFKKDLAEDVEVNSTSALLLSHLKKAQGLMDKFKEYEQQIRYEIMDEVDDSLVSIKSELKLVKALISEAPLSETRKEKLLFHQAELFRVLEIPTSPPSKAEALFQGLNTIEARYKELLSDNHKRVEKQYSQYLKRLTAGNQKFNQLGDLLQEVNQSIEDVKGLGLFADLKIGTSVAFFYQRENLKKLISKLHYGLQFINNNESYLNWKNFQKDLSLEDKLIIEQLAFQDGFWDEAFEEMFLAYYLNNSKSTLVSIESKFDELKDFVTNPQYGFDAKISSGVESSKASNSDLFRCASWDAVLNDFSFDLVDRYPIIFMSEEVYSKQGQQLIGHCDRMIFMNLIPSKFIEEEWLKNICVGFDPLFIELSNKLQKQKSELVVYDSEDIYFENQKSLAKLSLAERNRAAKYLGQELFNLNPRFRTYQLKNLSIISYWSDAKNAQLVNLFMEAGIKEIVSDKIDINLLPGIFADEDRQTFLLLEDGMFHFENTDQAFHQIQLIEALQCAGVKLFSIDNCKLINNRETEMNRVFSNISKADTTYTEEMNLVS